MKEQLQRKLEKGKEWFEENKIFVGFVAGCVLTHICIFADKKIMEPKAMRIETSFKPELEKGNFTIRVAGKDRFGRLSYCSPLVTFEGGEADKKRIDDAIYAAINQMESCNF